MKCSVAPTRPLAVLLLLALALPALAQLDDPDLPPLSATLAPPAVRAKGLRYSASLHGQDAAFAVSCVPSGGTAPYAYAWVATNGATIEGSGASVTVHLGLAAKSAVSCAVSDATPGASQTASAGTSVVAIGGPITTSVKPGSTANGDRTYEHDGNDPSKPFYLQYFGYAHNVAGTKPRQAQPTQGAILAVSGQPDGTTVTWDLPANIFYDPAKIHDLSLGVDADDEFDDQTPKAKFHFVNPDLSDPFTGDADDDSAETQDPYTTGYAPNQVTVWKPRVYHLSGHKPKELTGVPTGVTDVLTESSTSFSDTSGFVAWTDIKHYKYRLVDKDGSPMPGVWVEERFTEPIPPSFITNENDPYNVANFWTTREKSATGAGIDPQDGLWDEFDNLRYVWTTSNSIAWMNGVPVTWSTVHAYYAGTRDATASATSGVYVGSSKMTFVPGTPGTASQPLPAPPSPNP